MDVDQDAKESKSIKKSPAKKSQKQASVTKKPLAPQSASVAHVVSDSALETAIASGKQQAKKTIHKKVLPKKVLSKNAAAKKEPPEPSEKKTRAEQSQEKPAPNLGSAEFSVIADNMAELVDQGRKALAAALGGVDGGEARSELAASVADATKTLGFVAEYWLSKPERAAVTSAVGSSLRTAASPRSPPMASR